MTGITADSFLKVIRIFSIQQHVIIIIGLKKSSMTSGKMVFNLLTGITNICKYSDRNSFATDDKTMGICRVMIFGKACYSQVPNHCCFMCFKIFQEIPMYLQSAMVQCRRSYVYGK